MSQHSFLGLKDTEPIFKEGEKVWIFGDEKGKVIKETGFRIFLVEWEEDGIRAEIDYMSLEKRRNHDTGTSKGRP